MGLNLNQAFVGLCFARESDRRKIIIIIIW